MKAPSARIFLLLSFLIITTVSVYCADMDGKASDTPRAGLGDTLSEIDKAWNKGYREVFPYSGDSQSVRVGSSSKSAISYITGELGSTFGTPKRAGHLDGGTEGLFGAAPGERPTRSQFFAAITHLMPKDSKLISAYTRGQPHPEEDYIFESEWLKALPGIDQSRAYSSNPFKKGLNPVGSFFLFVTYDPDRPDHVMVFQLQLGTPGLSELEGFGMTRIPNPKFKFLDSK